MSLAASAQWQWLDKDGRKVFSDRAPPADILDKNILRRPGNRVPASDLSKSAAPVEDATPRIGAAVPQAAASAPKLSGVDKDLAEKKKKAEEAEAAKRKADEEKYAKAKAESCARAKQAKASLDSGRRISRANEKGEVEILDDAARANEIKRIQANMDSDCK